MSYPTLVCLDVDEMGGELNRAHMVWCPINDTARITKAIKDLSTKWPNSTICVYELTEMQKLKTAPSYQRYSVNKNGEVIPK